MTKVRMRAPFRYWGSKVRMAPWIIERLPEHNHYVEVFAGSAAVMAVKEPVDAETLNDTYGEVVNFFKVLRSPAMSSLLIDRVAFTPYSQAEFLEALDVDYESPVNRAWAFFIRMQMAVVPGRTGWSYGVQGASAKKANKPGRWSTMPELLQLCHQRFAKVQISDWDAVDLIQRLDAPGVLFFCDPPYLEDSRPTSTGASSAYVEDALDHQRFLDALFTTEHASFAVTHYPHPTYDQRPWTRVDDYESHRNIPNGGGRDKQTERLYIYDRKATTP